MATREDVLMRLRNVLSNRFSKKTKELIDNTMIFGLGTFGSKIILFFLVPLYSSVLAAEEYSNADLIVSSMSLVYPIFSLGIEQSIIRFGLTDLDNRENVLHIAIDITIVGGSLFTFLVIAVNLFYHVPYIGFIIILYFSSSLSHILASYAKAKEQNKTYAINAVLSAGTLCISNILTLLVLKLGVFGYLISVIIRNVVSVLFLSICCGVIPSYFIGRNIVSLKHKMIGYSLPLVPNTVSWWITQLSDRYLVKFISGDFINGLYSMAYKIPSVFNLFVTIFSQAFSLSVFKQMDKEKDNNFSQIYKYYVAITFLSGSFIILLSRMFAGILLKKSFYQSWVYIPILILAYVIGNLQAYYGNLFAGLKLSRQVFKTTLLGAVTNILLNILLIPKFNAYGAAIATVFSYLVIYYARYFILKRIMAFEHNIILNTICILIMTMQIVLYEVDIPICYVFSFVLFFVYLIMFNKELKTLLHKIVKNTNLESKKN